jgi:threonine/homoserine/homoserine lactone efflux protein
MDYLLPLVGLALANLLAAMSPGPGVLLVARIAVAGSRRAGLAAAAGMALGGTIWSSAAIFGLALLFSELAWLYRAVQVLGGLYLMYVAVMIWRGAAAPLALEGGTRPLDPRRAFTTALLSYLANPKVVVFFGSVFVALLPAHAPAWVWAATIAIVTVNEAAWYTTVALSFSAAPMRRAYARIRTWLDRAVAGLLAVLGLKLVLDAR